MPISPSLGGVSVPFLHRPGRMTKTNSLPKIFGQRGFFCINISKFGNLLTAFVYFDARLLVTQCSNGLLPCLTSRSWSKLTMPKNFGGLEFLAAKENEKNFSVGKWYMLLLILAHTDSIVCQCYSIDETTRINSFELLAKHLVFLRMSFGEFFWVSSRILGLLQETFY